MDSKIRRVVHCHTPRLSRFQTGNEEFALFHFIAKLFMSVCCSIAFASVMKMITSSANQLRVYSRRVAVNILKNFFLLTGRV